jgi:ferrous iron transport protein B
MTLQWIAVAVIVPLCALYAAWSLMGVALRRAVSARLAAMLPTAWARRLPQSDAAASACGCDGCDQPEGARKEQTPKQSIVRVHRRSSR